MDENLVGYLLKSLEPDEQRAVEAHLEAHPESRAKLEQLERALAPLAADAEDPEPPPGLALAALARVAEHKCRPLPAAPRPVREQPAATGWFRLRRADALAAAALLVVAAGLALPALVRVYEARDRAACAENLHQVWGALAAYSDQRPGRPFPMVESSGPRSVAAVFVPLLRDAGTLDGTFRVACPARPEPTPVANASLADLEAAYQRGGEEYGRLARNLAGGYAYSLGYRDGATLAGLRAGDDNALPVVADFSPGDGNSPNHGGTGQNVLYIGGNVRWCAARTVGFAGDDIYVNKHNQIHAGEGRVDTVLGPGDASPFGE